MISKAKFISNQTIVFNSIKRGNDSIKKLAKDTGLTPCSLNHALVRLKKWGQIKTTREHPYTYYEAIE